MSLIEEVRSRLPETEILAQLAEEASELSQAALKLRRAIDGVNPTLVKPGAAREALLEEYADVMACIEVLLTPTQNSEAVEIRHMKLERWVKRLEGEV